VCAQEASGVNGAPNRCVGAGGHSLADSPSGSGVFLRLHRAQPGDDVFGAARPASGKALIVQSLGGDGRVHGVTNSRLRRVMFERIITGLGACLV
jgi:hypothetical protein